MLGKLVRDELCSPSYVRAVGYGNVGGERHTVVRLAIRRRRFRRDIGSTGRCKLRRAINCAARTLARPLNGRDRLINYPATPFVKRRATAYTAILRQGIYGDREACLGQVGGNLASATKRLFRCIGHLRKLHPGRLQSGE